MEMIQAAEVFSEGDGDFSFPDTGRADEKERSPRTIRMSQVQFPSLENRANTRENVILSLDIGLKVRLQIAELAENF
jgi:hypothetical protein